MVNENLDSYEQPRKADIIDDTHLHTDLLSDHQRQVIERLRKCNNSLAGTADFPDGIEDVPSLRNEVQRLIQEISGFPDDIFVIVNEENTPGFDSVSDETITRLLSIAEHLDSLKSNQDLEEFFAELMKLRSETRDILAALLDGRMRLLDWENRYQKLKVAINEFENTVDSKYPFSV